MVEILRKLKPFMVPNYVIEDVGPRPRQEGPQEAPKHMLAELTPDVLAQMCDDFRAAVFAKSGMRDPAKG